MRSFSWALLSGALAGAAAAHANDSRKAIHTSGAAQIEMEIESSFDLRNVGGKNFLGAVRNHHLPLNSGCASCWAVTSASVIGDRLAVLMDKARIEGVARIEVSAQYLLNCVPGQRHCGYPGSASAAMRFVAQHGIPDESCAPWQNAWEYGVQQCDALHTCAEMMIDPKTHKPAEFPNHTMHLQPVENPRMYFIESDTVCVATPGVFWHSCLTPLT
eukprot:COSAG03_NODE_2938_length_2341_cov_3.695361_3_plen_216_part_00